MKKTFLLCLVTAFLCSCGDFKIAEKSVFVGNIPLKIYYEPIISVFQTQDGFVFTFTKSYTNGDSTKCEVFGRTEKIVTKIDHEGNKKWEFIDTSSKRNPSNLIEDKNHDFWGYEGNYLMKYDASFQLVSNSFIDFKSYNAPSANINRLLINNENKIVAVGTVSLSNNTYQTFLCELSDKGIQNWQLLPEKRTGYYTPNIHLLPNNKLLLTERTNDYSKGISTIKIEQFDKDYKSQKVANIELKTTSIGVENFSSFDNKLVIIYRESDTINKLAVFDDDLNRKDYSLNTLFGSYWLKFLPSKNGLYVSDGVSNVYVLDSLSFQPKLYVNVPYANNFFIIESGSEPSVVQIQSDNYGKDRGTITFQKTTPSNTTKKALYKSDYKRTCNIYLPE